MDIGSGVVECLCKRGYHGTKCGRCSSGYYGNPMADGGSCKPCNCPGGSNNICDRLTGECNPSGNGGDTCHECDSCTLALLGNLEQMDSSLDWLKQQVQSIHNRSSSLSRLSRLDVNISQTKTEFGRYVTAVRHLEPKVEQLEADVDGVRDDLSRLINKTDKTVSELEAFLNVNRTQLEAEDLLYRAKSMLAAVKGLSALMRQLAGMNPSDYIRVLEEEQSRMFADAQRLVQEMRDRNCTASKDKAGSEQELSHKLLDSIRYISPVQSIEAALNETSHSLMESHSALRDVAELLSNSEDTVSRTRGLNLKSFSTLQSLQHQQTQLKNGQSVLITLAQTTKELLWNITGMFSKLGEMKKDLESCAAETDGAKSELLKKLNDLLGITDQAALVIRAEKYAEELNQLAEDFQTVLHNAINRTEQITFLNLGAYNGIIHLIEKAELAANESRVSAEGVLKDVKNERLVNKTNGFKHKSTQLWKDANDTQRELQTLSHALNGHKDCLNEQKLKAESLTTDIKMAADNLQHIKRDYIDRLITSAKTAASASNSTVRDMTERLRGIRQEVDKITPANIRGDMDKVLNETEETLNTLNDLLPFLKDNLTRVEALGGSSSPNMTDSIQRIKDVIEETRNYVNRLTLVTAFNGKGHIELRPPRKLEDFKTFTVVDLLLNLHPNKAARRRRQNKHRHTNHFVFYLGDRNASGDYIGMSIRRSLLISVYKLGGTVHQVPSGEIITTTTENSTDVDRVLFYRLYQDAEVNATKNFTSQKSVQLSLNRNLPNTLKGLLQIDPENLVFYVGGYPDHFTPPVELQYPKYLGAIKLSYINDNPVSLFNFKHAVNIDAKQPHVNVRIPDLEASDYYEGTGYRMALIEDKNPRLFRFHTNSRETDALLFYIGNEESYFCVYAEKSVLVIRGRQGNHEIRARSAGKVSLYDTSFSIFTADQFKVQYGSELLSTDHVKTAYTSFYIGGLSAELRNRHNITAPALKGCMDHVIANTETVKYETTIGVGNGCPVLLLGVRTASLSSPLPLESLFDGEKAAEVQVSLGFKSTHGHSALLKSSSRGPHSDHAFLLALSDGHILFSSNNYTVKSPERYDDGRWHYVSALGRPSGLELSIDNIKLEQSLQVGPWAENMQGLKSKACVSNLHVRRFKPSFIPADLSLFQQTEDMVLGLCSLQAPQTRLLPAPVMTKPHTHKRAVVPDSAGGQCSQWPAQGGDYQLYEADSWLSYTVPHEELNHRLQFSFGIKTASSNGLILHVAGTGVTPLLALYLANGKIKMSLGPNRIIEHKQRSNDGKWHRVELGVGTSAFYLLVDGVRVTDGHLANNKGSSRELQNPVYLGAHTKRTVRKQGHSVPMRSFVGCIRDFRMNQVLVGTPETSYKALPCSDGLTEMGTYFGTSGGYIVMEKYLTFGPDFELSFELRPHHLTGLLLHVQSHTTRLNVFHTLQIRKKKNNIVPHFFHQVVVELNDGSGDVQATVSPPQTLCDGRFHSIKVSKHKEVLTLSVDSVSKQKLGSHTPTSFSTKTHSLYIGGTMKPNAATVHSPFVGCLRNVQINGRPVAFNKASRVAGNVSVNKCPAE